MMEFNKDVVFAGKFGTSAFVFPEYVGVMHLTDNFSVSLTKYPCLFHRIMIRLFFGWKFERYGDD